MTDNDDWMNGGPLNRGHFRKGQSGNPHGRPRKATRGGQALDYAADVLKAGDMQIVVTEGGRKRKMKAHQVMLHSLVKDAIAKEDRDAAKLYLRLHDGAMRTISAHKQDAYKKLGHYLKLVEEGRPPRLREAEAAFLQSVADEAGYDIQIKAYEPDQRPEPVTQADLDAIATAQLKRALGARFETMGEVEFRQIVSRILYADRKRRAEHDAVAPVWGKPDP